MAVAEDAVVGMLLGNIRRYLNWQELFVEDFCVVPAYQGQGVGSQLLDYASQQLKAEGIGNLCFLPSETTPP